MTTLKPAEFIQSVLIDELGGMIDNHPYISFIVIGIGIEFLGKCMDTSLEDWNVSGRSRLDFENAVKNIPSLKKYEPYLASHDLYGSYRCGLAHAVSPKVSVTLSSKNEKGHLIETNGRLNLKVEDFYSDFREACKHVMNDQYPDGDKMKKDFLQVPGPGYNAGTDIPTGITSSIDPSGSTA